MLRSGEVEMEKQKNKVLTCERDSYMSKCRAIKLILAVSLIVNICLLVAYLIK